MLERTLSEDITTLSAYHQAWWLKLSHAKTVMAAFRFHNREAKCELKLENNGKILPFCSVPTYLDVKLDKALTYRYRLEALRDKLSTRLFCVYISSVSTRPIGMSLTRTAWFKLNRLRTGVGRFDSSMHKWGLASSARNASVALVNKLQTTLF